MTWRDGTQSHFIDPDFFDQRLVFIDFIGLVLHDASCFPQGAEVKA
jgi:hypothetical protein